MNSANRNSSRGIVAISIAVTNVNVKVITKPDESDIKRMQTIEKMKNHIKRTGDANNGQRMQIFVKDAKSAQ